MFYFTVGCLIGFYFKDVYILLKAKKEGKKDDKED